MGSIGKTFSHSSSQTDFDSVDAAPTAAAAARDDDGDALKLNPMVINLVNREQNRRNRREKKEEEAHTKSSDDDKRPVSYGDQAGRATPTPSSLLLPPQRTVRVLKPAIEEECYPNDNPKRGLCLILEHSSFKPSLALSDRKGSEVDLKSANECFNKMGFEVVIRRDLTYKQVRTVLDEVADLDHSKHDCFALVMLSHGNDGTLYAYDSAYPTQRLWEPFTSDRAPTLSGKPKLFFLQACQGDRMDAGVRVVKATKTDSFASYKVPVHADFLIAHSTIAGFYSWRNTVAGSWYIQSLCRVLETDRVHRDVLSLLTMVNRAVTGEYESSSSRADFNGKKQTPFVYSTMTRKFYLEAKKVQNT